MNGVVYVAPREWTRVHPISPYLGSGPILGFLAIYTLTRITPSWVVGDSDEYEALDQVPVLPRHDRGAGGPSFNASATMSTG